MLKFTVVPSIKKSSKKKKGGPGLTVTLKTGALTVPAAREIFDKAEEAREPEEQRLKAQEADKQAERDRVASVCALDSARRDFALTKWRFANSVLCLHICRRCLNGGHWNLRMTNSPCLRGFR